MLEVEYYDASVNMSVRGSELLTEIMDTTTPLVDLLVRESIQNSLDASKSRTYGSKVSVSYIVGEFQTSDLSCQLEGISDKLNSMYKGDQVYIAIRDKGTWGLTGKMNKEDLCDDEDQGNLLKLVYDIRKSKTNQDDTGGSWGLGKTIYNRIGNGLVFYYSRIYNEDIKDYQSRLAGVLIEDQDSKSAILPRYHNAKGGIAWWGKKIRINKTIPITDEKIIGKFLNIFGLNSFYGSETGTLVIIPFINEENLLNSAKSWFDNLDEEDSVYSVKLEDCNWLYSLEDYFEIAVQRWYYPRLNNLYYKYGSYLTVDINGDAISDKDIKPLFKLQQALYNRAAYNGKMPYKYKDFISDNPYFISGNHDKTKNTFGLDPVGYKTARILTDPRIGSIAYAKVNKRILGMLPPQNQSNPYALLQLNKAEENSPIVAFCRKPGMIVWFANGDDFMKKVGFSEGDEYIIAQFVLNSDNTVKSFDMTLEKYIRATEKGSHRTWDDDNSHIVDKLKNKTAEKLSLAFTNKVIDDQKETINTEIGSWVGKKILPPLIGTKAIKLSKGGRKGGGGGSRKSRDLIIKFLGIEYYPQYKIKYEIEASSKCRRILLNLAIANDSAKDQTLAEWEEAGLKSPFMFKQISTSLVKVGNKSLSDIVSVDNEAILEVKNAYLKSEMQFLDSGTTDKCIIDFLSDEKTIVKLDVVLDIVSKTYKPIVSINKAEK